MPKPVPENILAAQSLHRIAQTLEDILILMRLEHGLTATTSPETPFDLDPEPPPSPLLPSDPNDPDSWLQQMTDSRSAHEEREEAKRTRSR